MLKGVCHDECRLCRVLRMPPRFSGDSFISFTSPKYLVPRPRLPRIRSEDPLVHPVVLPLTGYLKLSSGGALSLEAVFLQHAL
jgi:hypothetical protein